MFIFFAVAILTLFTIYFLHKEALGKLKFMALRNKRKEIIALGKEIRDDFTYRRDSDANGKLLRYHNRIKEYKAILEDCEKYFAGPEYSKSRKKIIKMAKNDDTRVKRQKNRWNYIIATRDRNN